MSADILPFLPRTRTANQERAFWIGSDREAILKAGAVEIEQVRVVDQGRPSDSAFHVPDTDPA